MKKKGNKSVKCNRDSIFSQSKITGNGNSFYTLHLLQNFWDNDSIMENTHSNPSTDDDSNCRPDSQCPNDASNISEEEQSVPNVKPLQNLVLSKAYRPVAAKILQQLDPESFLACRLVCKDWREMVNLHRPKWKEINQADIGSASSRGDKLLVELLISKGHDVNPPHTLILGKGHPYVEHQEMGMLTPFECW